MSDGQGPSGSAPLPSPSSTPAPRATLKRQPKNATRRSKAERDALERDESKRRAERLRQAQADERAAEQSRKAQYGYGGHGDDSRGGRGGQAGAGRGRIVSRAPRGGRGGFMGGGGAMFGGRGRGGSDSNHAQSSSGRGGGIRRNTGVKKDNDGDTTMTGLSHIKREKDVFELDSDSDGATGRVDIEKLMEHVDLVSDEDDEAIVQGSRAKTPAKDKIYRGFGMPPVRLPRQEHAERTLGVNTEASAASVKEVKKQLESPELEKASLVPPRKNKGKGKDVQYMGEKKLFRGVYEDEDETTPAIKPDPDAPDLDPAVGEHEISKTKTPARARRKSSNRRAKSPPVQTEEEKREREIQQHEAWAIRAELGPSESHAPATQLSPSILQGEQQQEASGEQNAEEHDQRANNVYLFQLPPVLPGLVRADAPKDDGAEAGAEKSEQTVKQEHDVGGNATQAQPQGKTQGGPSLEPGRVGKLQLHRSGKTRLNWGGTSLQLGMGIDGRFLQSVVLMELPDSAAADASARATESSPSAKSFGQVRGKFVVTPDWAEILH